MRHAVFSELMRESDDVRMHLYDIVIGAGRSSEKKEETGEGRRKKKKKNQRVLLMDEERFAQDQCEVVELVWLDKLGRAAYLASLEHQLRNKQQQLYNLSQIHVANTVLAEDDRRDMNQNNELSFHLWSQLHLLREKCCNLHEEIEELREEIIGIQARMDEYRDWKNIVAGLPDIMVQRLVNVRDHILSTVKSVKSTRGANLLTRHIVTDVENLLQDDQQILSLIKDVITELSQLEVCSFTANENDNSINFYGATTELNSSIWQAAAEFAQKETIIERLLSNSSSHFRMPNYKDAAKRWAQFQGVSVHIMMFMQSIIHRYLYLCVVGMFRNPQNWLELFEVAGQKKEIERIVKLYRSVGITMNAHSARSTSKDDAGQWLDDANEFLIENPILDFLWDDFAKNHLWRKTKLVLESEWTQLNEIGYSSNEDLKHQLIAEMWWKVLRTGKLPNLLDITLKGLSNFDKIEFKLAYENYMQNKDQTELEFFDQHLLTWKPIGLTFQETQDKDNMLRKFVAEIRQLFPNITPHLSARDDSFDEAVKNLLRVHLMQEYYRVSASETKPQINLCQWVVDAKEWKGDSVDTAILHRIISVVQKVAWKDYRHATEAHVPKALKDYCKNVTETRFKICQHTANSHGPDFFYDIPTSIRVQDSTMFPFESENRGILDVCYFSRDRSQLTHATESMYPYTKIRMREKRLEVETDETVTDKDGNEIAQKRDMTGGNVIGLVKLCQEAMHAAQAVGLGAWSQGIHTVFDYECQKNEHAMYVAAARGQSMTPMSALMLKFVTSLICSEEIARLVILIKHWQGLRQREAKRATLIAYHENMIENPNLGFDQQAGDEKAGQNALLAFVLHQPRSQRTNATTDA